MAVSKPTRRAPSAPARSAPARSAPSAPVRRTPAAPVRRTPSAPTPRAPMTAQEQRNLDSINARRAAREGGNTVNNSNVAFPVNPPANPQQTNADAFGEGRSNIPVSDLYSQYINQFEATNPELSNQYREQFNGYGVFSDTSNQINNMYDTLTNQTNNLYGAFANINKGLDQDITGKLTNAYEQAYAQYGPQGEQTNRMEAYYRNLADNMAMQNAVQTGSIDAQSLASGASAGAQRNATAATTIDANTQYAQMQQQQLSDYDNIYKTLNEYYNSFIQNYANSKNIYVRETYAQLVDAMDQINKARHSTLTNLSTSMLEKNMRDEEYEREARRLASTGGDGGSGILERQPQQFNFGTFTPQAQGNNINVQSMVQDFNTLNRGLNRR